MSNKIYINYSYSLFELASDENKIDIYRENAILFYDMLSTEGEFHHFICSPLIQKSLRKEVALEAMNNKYEQNFMNFICLIIDNSLTGYIEVILNAFITMCNKHLKIVKIEVQSSTELSKSTIDLIVKNLNKNNSKSSINYKIVPELISGLKIFVDEKVIDNTMLNHLSLLKDELMKGE